MHQINRSICWFGASEPVHADSYTAFSACFLLTSIVSSGSYRHYIAYAAVAYRVFYNLNFLCESTHMFLSDYKIVAETLTC